MVVKFKREWAMPNKDTFSIKPIGRFVARMANGIVCDPFAGNCGIAKSLRCKGYLSNDIDVEKPTMFHADALEFLRAFPDSSVDTVIFDPPYSPRQVSECYRKVGHTVNMKTTQASFWSMLKKEIARIVKPGGIVLSFGWNTNGIGKGLGFELEEVLIVAHGGWHNDTLCIAERKERSLWD